MLSEFGTDPAYRRLQGFGRVFCFGTLHENRAGIGVRIERPTGVDLTNSMYLSHPPNNPGAYLVWQAMADALLVALQHDLTVVHLQCPNLIAAGQVRGADSSRLPCAWSPVRRCTRASSRWGVVD